jgi:hypothetical protein
LPAVLVSHAWPLAALAIFAAALLAVGYYRVTAGAGYPLDDSWIHFSYARNIAEGNGFGANAGEPAPGATSPLWVVLLAPGFLFGETHGVWPWLIAALVLGAAGLLCARLVAALPMPDRSSPSSGPPVAESARTPGAPLLAVACGIAVAWTGPLVWSAAGAMETPLLVALVAAMLLAFASRGGSGWQAGLLWGALGGLAGLARPEGLLLAPILAALSLTRASAKAAVEAFIGLAACAVVYSPSVFFCLSTSGRVFPNTFYAKTTALVAGAPDAGFIAGTFEFLLKQWPLAFVALAIGITAIVAGFVGRRPLRPALAVAAFAIGLPLAYASMGRTFLFAGLAGNFGRYLYPILPAALVLGFWGTGFIWQRYKLPRRANVFVVTLAIVLVLAAVGTARRASLYRHNVDDVNAMQVAMAKRLMERLEPGAYVAANDVGAISYLTGFRVLDLVGIISTQTLEKLENAGTGRAARQRAFYELIVEERPEVLVVFPGWFGPTIERFGDALERIEAVSKQDNITSGGPRLVAFKVHWDRI